MTIEFNPEKTEVIETLESKNFTYEKVLFKDINMTVRVRKIKENKNIRSSSNYIPQLCLEDIVSQMGYINNDPKTKLIDEFMKHPIVCYSKKNISRDDEDGNNYIDPISLNTMLVRMQDAPTHSQLDWNVTEPNALTIIGFLNVSKGAILAGFKFDNEKFQSLATSNSIANIMLNGDDGSGHLAGGNILWDALGNLLIRGIFESNANGNKIVIDPTTRNIRLINPDKGVLGSWSFFSTGSILQLFHKPSDVQIDETQMNGNTISFSMKNTNSGLSYNSRIGVTGVKFDINIFPTKNRLSELEVGELYRDGDIIKMKITN